MKLELRARAVTDLAGIRAYLIEHASEQVAESVRQHFVKRFKTLQKRPQLGIESTYPGVRILSPTKYPYRIYFTMTKDAVVILHVRHTSRDLPKSGEIE